MSWRSCRTKEIEMLESFDDDDNNNNVIHDQNNGTTADEASDDDDTRSQASDDSTSIIPSKWLDINNRLPTDSEYHHYMSGQRNKRGTRKHHKKTNTEFTDAIAIFVQEWTSHAITNAASNGLFDTCMKHAADDEIHCEYHMFEDVHDRDDNGVYELPSVTAR